VSSPPPTPSSAGKLKAFYGATQADTPRWRSQFRTDKLYSEINLVLSKFCEPYYQLFMHVDRLLSSTEPLPANASLPLLAQSLQLLVQLFQDLSSQDLPPYFEDNLTVFMGTADGSQEGWLRKYLSWERAELKGDVSYRARVTLHGPGSSHFRTMTRHLDHSRRSARLYARSPSCTPKNTSTRSRNWVNSSSPYGAC
jgi:hypothetical protein